MNEDDPRENYVFDPDDMLMTTAEVRRAGDQVIVSWSALEHDGGSATLRARMDLAAAEEVGLALLATSSASAMHLLWRLLRMSATWTTRKEKK